MLTGILQIGWKDIAQILILYLTIYSLLRNGHGMRRTHTNPASPRSPRDPSTAKRPSYGNRVTPLQGLTIFGAPHVGLCPTLVPDALSGLCRVAPLQGLTISGASHVGLRPIRTNTNLTVSKQKRRDFIPNGMLVHPLLQHKFPQFQALQGRNHRRAA